jgi:hypothetical protein
MLVATGGISAAIFGQTKRETKEFLRVKKLSLSISVCFNAMQMDSLEISFWAFGWTPMNFFAGSF